MKTKFFAVVVALFMFAAVAQSQDYKSAIGLRLGYPLSASYKTFISEKGAFEGVAGFRSYSTYSWFNVGAYYQHHTEIPSVDGLKWYYGAGANIYFWSFDFVSDASSTSIGLSGVLGLDYKLKDTPLNLSVDWIPTFFINGYQNGFGGGYGALAARYVLN
ncbi:MAG: hypothetical protein WAU01_13835 [Saprospiraceae bacterium]